MLAALTLGTPGARAADLSEIFRYALASDPLLSSAEYERYAVEGDKDAVCGRLWPQVSVPGSYTVFDQSEAGSVLNEDTGTTGAELSGKQARIGVKLNQTLFDMPAFTSCRKARIEVDLGNVVYEQALEDLIYRTVRGYIGVLEAKTGAGTAQAKASLYEAQFNEAKKGYEDAKTVSKLELALAEERWKKADADRIAAEKALDTAQAELAEITGSEFSANELAILRRDKGIAYPEPADLRHWQGIAEKENLRVIESVLSVRIAQYGMKTAYGEMWPSVDAFARHTMFENDINRSGAALATDNDGFSTDAIGVAMEVPLFTGGTNKGAANAATNRFKSERKKTEAMVRGIHTEVRAALGALTSTDAEIKAAKAMLDAAEANHMAVKGGVEAKTKTATDLLNAESVILEAQENMVSARYAYVMAMVDFWRSVGALSAASVEEVNALLESGNTPAEEVLEFEKEAEPELGAQQQEEIERQAAEKPEEIKPEEVLPVFKEEVKQEEVKQEEVKQEEVKQEEVKQEEVKQEEAPEPEAMPESEATPEPEAEVKTEAQRQEELELQSRQKPE